MCYATLWVVWGLVERGGSLMNVLVPRECLLDSLTNWFCTAKSVSLERNQLLGCQCIPRDCTLEGTWRGDVWDIVALNQIGTQMLIGYLVLRLVWTLNKLNILKLKKNHILDLNLFSSSFASLLKPPPLR